MNKTANPLESPGFRQDKDPVLEDNISVRTFLNYLLDGVRILDRDLRIVSLNKVSLNRNALESIPIGEKCHLVFRNRNTPCAGCPCLESLREGTMKRAEIIDTDHKEERCYEVSAFPISGEDGTIVGVIEVSRDISEQRSLQKQLEKEKEKYRQLFHSNGDAIFIRYLYDDPLKGNFVEVNMTACSMYGYTKEEFLAMSPQDILSPGCRELLADMTEHIQKGQSAFRQLYHIKKSGELFPVEVEIKPYELFGQPAIIAFVRDISGRIEAQEALQSRESLYMNLFHNNHAIMLVIDPETGDLKDVNPAALKYYGYSREEMLNLKGCDLNALSREEHKEVMRKSRNGEQNLFRFRHKLKDGEMRDVEVFTGPIEMDDKKYLYSIVHDITERIEAEDETRRLNEELLRISRTDKLTGIFNRAYLEEILFREIDKAKRYQTCLCLIMFDLDNYKNINDSLGHLAGDVVLRRVADAVNANVRNSDFLARWGGDEFMVLTPMRLPSALKFAEKLRSVIEDLHCGVTASFGVAEFSREDTIDQLTRRVDRALYRAKGKGRNRVCSYED